MKAQVPVIGRATGRSGGMIFQSYHGHTYLRSMPAIFHYPDTKEQQITQGRYYNIMWQFQSIYNSFSKAIPKACRFGKNTYDVLSHGVFRASQTFPTAQAKEPPRWFGNDIQQQVRVLAVCTQFAVVPEVVRLRLSVTYSTWRRQFSPVMYHLILVNSTRQQLIAVSASYAGSEFTVTFENPNGWQQTDTIRPYFALSNTEFMSNFYRVSL